MPRRNFFVILAAVAVSFACYRATDHNRYGRYFAEVMSKIDRYYVRAVDDDELFDAAVNGMLEKLDENSRFYEPGEARTQLLSIIDQRYGGVGVEVGEDPDSGQLVIRGTIVGSPAYAAGLLVGDRVVRIDEWPVKADSRHGDPDATSRLFDRATKLIRGPIGSSVRLELMRAGQKGPIDVTLVRSEIKTDSVLGDSRNADDSWNFLLAGHPQIGYIRIRAFGDRTADELHSALQAIDADQLGGLVLDLRGDPGGRLDAAIDVCSMFIPAGQTIVTTRGRDAEVFEREMSHGPAICTQVPMVVLIDSMSASASEIVSACLQDYHRAVVCGERSFGKGTVQRLIPLRGNNSLLKLTTATYWRPSNKNIQRPKDAKDSDQWGVLPDQGFAIKMSEKQTEAWLKNRADRDVVRHSLPPGTPPVKPDLSVDPQLSRAIDFLEHGRAANS